VGFRPLPGAVLSPDPTGDAFRPVGRQLHFWLVGHLCGASPVAAHVANLGLFLTVLALLAWIAVRLVGPYAAILTVALAGMSYALEVPVLSASGAQYLIALAAALASSVFYVKGARQTAAVAWASARRRQGRTNTSSRVERRGPRGIFVGLLWAVGGSLPVILVIPTWSAHQYLFGLCGVWLLLGAWAARQPRWVGPTLVAVA